MSLESILKFILICLLIFQAPELSLFLCYELLTHISQASFLWDIENSTDLDQTPHKAVFDQGFHYLYTAYSFKI